MFLQWRSSKTKGTLNGWEGLKVHVTEKLVLKHEFSIAMSL